MATTPRPPEPAAAPPGFGMAPGSAELSVYVLALAVAAVVTWIFDGIEPGSWFDFFKWATAAYLLSRGIAKASRVYEY